MVEDISFIKIDIGKLSKPATVLLEMIHDAISGFSKPFQIKRVAKAEAEAALIHAQSEIEVTELHRRALNRFLQEEGQKQLNMEQITSQALPQVNDEAKPEDVDKDWITNFFDKCRIISDAEMQSLWSRILAGEANSPGTFSKRTVNFISSLDKEDAELFTKLCSLAWFYGNYYPIVYNPDDSIFTKYHIFFSTLNHLDSIGLITFNSLGHYSLKEMPKTINMTYFDKNVKIEFSEEGKDMNIGKILLTLIGQQLAPICGSKPDYEFYEYTLSKWTEIGYKILSKE
jgi:hypothetical protein